MPLSCPPGTASPRLRHDDYAPWQPRCVGAPLSNADLCGVTVAYAVRLRHRRRARGKAEQDHGKLAGTGAVRGDAVARLLPNRLRCNGFRVVPTGLEPVTSSL